MNTLEEYLTVNREARVEIIVEKSRFIAYCKRVASQEEAEEFISQIRKKHYDATHNVPAYRLHATPLIEKSSDDGEPSGTAGLPILNLFRQRNIKNVCIVVTRYFGGIKLGKGGLVRAYAQAAKEALRESGLISKEIVDVIRVELAYPLWGRVQNELERRGTRVKETLFTDIVSVVLYSKPEETKALIGVLIDLTEGKASIDTGQQQYLDIEVEL